MKYQLNLFFLALGFFSRLPIPKSVTYSELKLNQSSRYFMLVGWLLGALVASVYYIANHFFSEHISIWLAMVFSLFLTGCFHEDGFADMADGFGGGLTVERKLTIMKDSRLGTYGVTSLILLLLGKFLLLSESQHIVIALIVAYGLSRGIAASFIYDMDYVTDIEESKSKPLANNQNKSDFIILILTAIPPFWLVGMEASLILLAVLLAFRTIFKAFLYRHIQGYTGDCLGAAQQAAEILIYFTLLLIYQNSGMLTL